MDWMSETFSSAAFMNLVYLVGFTLALIPGMWAAFMGLKALLYYVRMKLRKEKML
jgi:hypothetical protein